MDMIRKAFSNKKKIVVEPKWGPKKVFLSTNHLRSLCYKNFSLLLTRLETFNPSMTSSPLMYNWTEKVDNKEEWRVGKKK